MDIYITGNLPKNENDSGRSIKLRIPALPPSITYRCGAQMAEYQILDKGPVSLPSGNELTEYEWSAILPGKGHKNQPWIRGKWIDPKTIENYFSVWKKNGVKLKLLITGTPVNAYVYLKDYEITFSGAHGDYSYSVTFISAIDIKVSYTKVSRPAPKRTVPEKKSSKRTHKVKSGDCLWNIAKKYYGNGSQYTKIYKANKSVIESTAKKHGYSSSRNGHWIFPGTVLTIP